MKTAVGPTDSHVTSPRSAALASEKMAEPIIPSVDLGPGLQSLDGVEGDLSTCMVNGDDLSTV